MTDLINSTPPRAASRIALWDNLKAFLIFTVVAGHFVDTLRPEVAYYKQIFTFIYAFHMPLFIFISGLFHSNKNILKKCLFFISTAFLLNIFVRVSESVLLGGKFSISLFSTGGTPWYMFALAVYTALFYLLRNENKTVLLFMSILVACFAGYDKTVGDYLAISRILIFFPFYTLGTMIDPEAIINLRKKLKALAPVLGFAIILAWALLCFFKFDFFTRLTHLFTGKNAFRDAVIDYGALYRLLCYFISFTTCAALILLAPTKKIRFFTGIGQKTINIYFWHRPFVYAAGLISLPSGLSPAKEDALGVLLLAIPAVITIILSLNIFDFPLKQLKNQIYQFKSKERRLIRDA